MINNGHKVSINEAIELLVCLSSPDNENLVIIVLLSEKERFFDRACQLACRNTLKQHCVVRKDDVVSAWKGF